MSSLHSKLSRGPMGTLRRLRVNFEGEFDAVCLLVLQTLTYNHGSGGVKHHIKAVKQLRYVVFDWSE